MFTFDELDEVAWVLVSLGIQFTRFRLPSRLSFCFLRQWSNI